MNLHRYSGIFIALFVGLHLANHAVGLAGVEQHIQTMQTLRVFYRNPVAETILLLAVLVQVVSGGRLFWHSKKRLLLPPKPLNCNGIRACTWPSFFLFI